MSREMPKIEQTDPNIKENKEYKKLTVISSDNCKSNKKVTQNLTLKEPQEMLHQKLKT